MFSVCRQARWVAIAEHKSFELFCSIGTKGSEQTPLVNALSVMQVSTPLHHFARSRCALPKIDTSLE